MTAFLLCFIGGVAVGALALYAATPAGCDRADVADGADGGAA